MDSLPKLITTNIGAQSIRLAHGSVGPGSLMVNAGELLGANANRSPTAYEANPPQERGRYAHDTDKLMTQLKLVDEEGRCAATIRAFCPSGL